MATTQPGIDYPLTCTCRLHRLLSGYAEQFSVFDQPLEVFEAANCGLTGSLPDVDELSAAINRLEVLDLHGNQIEGPIPDSWTLLGKLSCLQLHNNPSLCGDVPDDLTCFVTSGTALGEW